MEYTFLIFNPHKGKKIMLYSRQKKNLKHVFGPLDMLWPYADDNIVI